MKKEKTLNEIKQEIKVRFTEKINRWKHDHKTVKMLFVGDDTDLKVLFFRQPNRHELAAAENLSTTADGQVDLYKKGDRQLTDCFLGGDYSLEEILADTSVYMPAVKFVLFQLVEEKKSSWDIC